jgi:hypothetical protein
MQKWEYCVIGEITYFNVSGAAAYRCTNKGFELLTDFKNRQKGVSELAAVGQFITQLGEDGWEMTGVGNTSELWHCLYFKRPKP